VKHFLAGVGILALVAAVGPAPTVAATAAPATQVTAADSTGARTPEEAATLERIERYLNGISTVRARFLQVSSNGDTAEGDVYMDRPGKLRFEYDPPVPVLIIADSLNLVYYDRDLQQVTYLPLWETPLWFLLRGDVSFADKVRVVDFERRLGTVRVVVEQKDNEQAGKVTLIFSTQPLALKKWEVTDAQGIVTTVSLLEPEFGVKIPADLFRFKDPTGTGATKGR
jgi:outer membrane lipoprotein-sorting protein